MLLFIYPTMMAIAISAALVLVLAVHSPYHMCTAATAATERGLLSTLEAVGYANEGVVSASDVFVFKKLSSDVQYLEAQNVSVNKGTWARHANRKEGSAYLFKVNETAPFSGCTVHNATPGYDRPGGDIDSVVITGPEGSNFTDLCVAKCCDNPQCYGFVFLNVPFKDGNCEAGQPCCFLKGKNVPAPTPSTLVGITSALVRHDSNHTTCAVNNLFPGTDMPGNDLTQVVMTPGPTDNATQMCAEYCCDNPLCRAFLSCVAPSSFGNCQQGKYCCYLKTQATTPTKKPSLAHAVTGTVVRPPPPPPVISGVLPPPSGMRSAIPLGGVSAGSFELRGDGSLHEFTIQNQSPGGAAKVQVYEHAFLAVKAG